MTYPRRMAPWPDYAGAAIREGDRISHPDGRSGVVVYIEGNDEPWRVRYDGDEILARLQLQVGHKGQARVLIA